MINQSPFRAPSIETAMRFIQAADVVLLTEDGVYGAQSSQKYADLIKNTMANNEVYVLGPDVKARGLEGKLLDGIKTVDYEGFVDLVEKHNVNTWL